MDSLNKDKYYNAILYFIIYCNNRYLGRTKLNKLLYYLDFISYRDRKNSVTGDTYVCNHFGPVPKSVQDIKKQMNGKMIEIEVGNIDIANDGTETMKEFYKQIQNKIVIMDVFDDYEKKLLDNIKKEFIDYSTKAIVTQTHFEAPWFFARKGDTIDYNYANDIEFFENN